MRARRLSAVTLLSIAAAFLFAACHDNSSPTTPEGDDARPAQVDGTQEARADLEQVFRRAAPEVLALPRTVFADHDEDAGQLVFGVEHAGVARGVETALARLGVPASAYEVKVTEPIQLMATLRDQHRPTFGGIQIHFSNFLCTLGFNVDHAGGRSFVTNSHCTDQQGGTEGTTYFQPLDSVDPNPIGVEADDPEYFRGGECPRGRRCRFSDASRALYSSGVESLGEIGRTSGPNNGSLEVVGTFDVNGQDDASTSFSGTLNKVGRTTGWTQGNVSATCVTVNVSGSNITQLCQTLVEGSGQIVGGGDSGSPVFRQTGSSTATLVGILWGGNASGDLFVFSPLKNIVDELGSMDATGDGAGDGGGGGDGGGDGGDDGGDDDDGGPNCPPTSNNPRC